MCNITLSGIPTYVAKDEVFLIVLECHTSPLIFRKSPSVSGCCGLILSAACYLLNFSYKPNICALTERSD